MTYLASSQQKYQKRPIKKATPEELALESKVLSLLQSQAKVLNTLLYLNHNGSTYASQRKLALLSGVGGTKSPETAGCKITTVLDDLDLCGKYGRPWQTCIYKINRLFLSPYIIAVLSRYLPALLRYISICQQIIQYSEKKEERETRYRKVPQFGTTIDDDVGFAYEHPPFC